MSLAVLADHMASKGRGNDSMLVHMTPREVAGLQALAKAHGGSLTINPDTGLPEAGWVDKLLPTIIGAGISFFSGGATGTYIYYRAAQTSPMAYPATPSVIGSITFVSALPT